MQKKTAQNNKKTPNAVQNLSANKNTKTPRIKIDKASRAKFECSEELAELIKQANMLPKDFSFSMKDLIEKGDSYTPIQIIFYEFLFSLPDEIKDFVFISDERKQYAKSDSVEYWVNNDGNALDHLADLNANDEISDELYNKVYDSDIQVIAEFLVEYGYYGSDYSYTNQLKKEKAKSFEKDYFIEQDDYSYRKEDSDDFDKIMPFVRALDRLQNIKKFLLEVVNLSKSLEESKKYDSRYYINSATKNDSFYQSGLKAFESKEIKTQVFATSFDINDQGEITFSISDWAKALQGVDITRIRLCEVCGNIFWASRKDAFACSKQHAKTRQMRLLRANWREKGDLYKKARNIKKNKKKDK